MKTIVERTTVLNPFSISLKKDPFMNVDTLVYEEGDFKIYHYSKDHFIHTFKNIVIAERVKPNKTIFTNIKGETQPAGISDIYHQLERPEWAKDEGIKEAKRLNFQIK